MRNILLLICFLLFSAAISNAEEMIFSLYGVAPTNEYPSLDWPEQIDVNKWRCALIDIEEKWWAYVYLNTYQLANIINHEGFISLEVEDHVVNLIKKSGDYIFLPMPEKRELDERDI